MRYENAAIRGGLAGSSPFARWQAPWHGAAGGTGLFTRCAAGYTGAAVAIRVND